jgi:hypothetical protein
LVSDKAMGDKIIIIPGETDLKKLELSGGVNSGMPPANPWPGAIEKAARAAVPDLSEEFFAAVTFLPKRAATLWANVMEGSVRTAAIDFSWKDPLDLTGKKIFKNSHSLPNGFLDGGIKLANEIEALAKKVVDAKILSSEDGRQAIEDLNRLSDEVAQFLGKNPGKGEGASWAFTLETPFDARLAKIAEMPLPEGREFLTALFNDMTRIIETVDINLAKPRHEGAFEMFRAEALGRIYGNRYGLGDTPFPAETPRIGLA